MVWLAVVEQQHSLCAVDGWCDGEGCDAVCRRVAIPVRHRVAQLSDVHVVVGSASTYPAGITVWRAQQPPLPIMSICSRLCAQCHSHETTQRCMRLWRDD